MTFNCRIALEGHLESVGYWCAKARKAAGSMLAAANVKRPENSSWIPDRAAAVPTIQNPAERVNKAKQRFVFLFGWARQTNNGSANARRPIRKRESEIISLDREIGRASCRERGQ